MANELTTFSPEFAQRVIAATRWVEQHQGLAGTGSRPTAPAAGGYGSCIVPVQNGTGGTRNAMDIVQISTYLFSPNTATQVSSTETDATFTTWKERIRLVGTAPGSPIRTTGNLHELDGRTIAIYLAPCPAGEIAPAVLRGPCQARVNIRDLSHRFAVPVEGDCVRLASADSGPIQILATLDGPNGDGTGNTWATVCLGEPHPVGARFGKIVSTWDRTTSSFTVNPCDVYGANTITAETVRVYVGGFDASGAAALPAVDLRASLATGDIIAYWPTGTREGSGTKYPEGVLATDERITAYGKLTADWVDGENHVHVTLCDADGDSVGYGTGITCRLFTPAGASPTGLAGLTTGVVIRMIVGRDGAGAVEAHALGIMYGGTHNLLSTMHPDTTAGTPAGKGSVIASVGTLTFTWDMLAATATASLLVSDTTLGARWLAATGSTTNFLRGDFSFAEPAGADHNLLSSKHTDTTASSPPGKGDVIAGDASSQWAALAANATQALLMSDATNGASWFGLPASATSILKATTAAFGYIELSGTATEYLDGSGAFSTPAGKTYSGTAPISVTGTTISHDAMTGTSPFSVSAGTGITVTASAGIAFDTTGHPTSITSATVTHASPAYPYDPPSSSGFVSDVTYDASTVTLTVNTATTIQDGFGHFYGDEADTSFDYEIWDDGSSGGIKSKITAAVIAAAMGFSTTAGIVAYDGAGGFSIVPTTTSCP